ncbi:DUF2336 domain-containing protein [Brevundimonas aveniformis]|uniref:DUF2336 domain-containing protein n=1 Tax=Brevundimonas aveniformis TaxID=370977 RepID=UPI000407C4EA|nr:DUF2336 domain-containing protein [Brevundimonas aveniformis]
MTVSRLQDLIDLAKTPSSDKRRELLRELTDQFFGTTPPSPVENELYGAVLAQLATEMEETVRRELSVRFSAAPNAPRVLARSLAMDVEGVAEPVLRHSKVLAEADLLDIGGIKGQGHLRAMSEREAVTESVSDLIIARGDDQTVGSLIRNNGAQLSRAAHEAVTDRAMANPELQADLVNRASMPPDLLNEMYFVVETQLRQKILERNAGVAPEKLEAALAVGRHRLRAEDGSLPPDFETARAYVRELQASSSLTPEALVRLLRSGGRTEFLIALAELSGIDFHTAQKIVEAGQIDALAVVCKSVDMDRAIFLTYAVVLLNKEGDAMGKAQAYGRMYAELTRETAQRTLRFWKLRREAEASVAA